jgi:arsenate reductase (thioredoxin)
MKKILFVCLGNVGRSQMAEAFYNTFTNSQDSWSAGIQANTPAKYGTPTKNIVDAMNDFNIDVSSAKVKTINQDIIDQSESIIILCPKNECPNILLNSNKNIFWEGIADPHEASDKDTSKIRDLIKQKISSFIKE